MNALQAHQQQMNQVHVGNNQHFGGPSHGHMMNTPDLLNNQNKAMSQNFPQNQLMTNGDLPENINIPPSYQNRPQQKPVMPVSKDQRAKPKPNGRKPTPNGDKKTKDPNSKGPSVKKVKIIESIKLHFVQQYFRASDMANFTENPEVPEPVIPSFEEMEQKLDEEAEEEVAEEKPAEEEPEVQEEDEQIEEREPEQHEEYVPDEEQEKESSHNFEPYDPNDVMEIEVKVSTKVKGLKKMILEKIELYKKANIIMLKKSEQINKPIEQAPVAPIWVEMTDADMEQPVKVFMNQTIAFKAYMSISVCVEGRGQSYHQQLQIDPMDQLERTMKSKTHFWKTFMMRGNQKCMVVIHHKGAAKDQEPEFVHPDSLNSTFKDIGVADKCQITLVELRGGANNDMESDDGEGGEEDQSDQFNEEAEEE